MNGLGVGIVDCRVVSLAIRSRGGDVRAGQAPTESMCMRARELVCLCGVCVKRL